MSLRRTIGSAPKDGKEVLIADGTYFSGAQIAAHIASGLTAERRQKHVAAELGVSEAFLSDVLSGRRDIGPTILKALGYDPTPHFRRATEV